MQGQIAGQLGHDGPFRWDKPAGDLDLAEHQDCDDSQVLQMHPFGKNRFGLLSPTIR